MSLSPSLSPRSPVGETSALDTLARRHRAALDALLDELREAQHEELRRELRSAPPGAAARRGVWYAPAPR